MDNYGKSWKKMETEAEEWSLVLFKAKCFNYGVVMVIRKSESKLGFGANNQHQNHNHRMCVYVHIHCFSVRICVCLAETM